jgi:hypothetical protein
LSKFPYWHLLSTTSQDGAIVDVESFRYALAPACLTFWISRYSSSGKSRLLFLSLAGRQSVVQVPISVFVSAATRTLKHTISTLVCYIF